MRSVGVPAGLSQGRRLPAVLWIGLAPLFLTGGSASSEQRCPSQYLGVWEYRQRAGDGYDIEGERIELPDLKVTSSGTLTFTVPERELFLHRPKNLQEVRQNRLTAAGFTRDTLHMQGRLDQGNLALTCVSRASSCPEDLIVFHKGK